jgi:Fe-coproporphyrin III synthase
VHFLENRYQALVPAYYETGRSPLPCSALSTSCFIDAYWNLFPCSIWDEKIGNLRESGFDFERLWNSPRRLELRRNVVEENCPHCWTPCEAYPTVLANLARAVTARSGNKEIPASAHEPIETKN